MSRKEVVEYSADSFTLMPICTLYVGLAKKGTSVGGTLNSTSASNLSVVSNSTFSTITLEVDCEIIASDSFLKHQETVDFSVYTWTGYPGSVGSFIRMTYKHLGRWSLFAEGFPFEPSAANAFLQYLVLSPVTRPIGGCWCWTDHIQYSGWLMDGRRILLFEWSLTSIRRKGQATQQPCLLQNLKVGCLSLLVLPQSLAGTIGHFEALCKCDNHER